jgi:phosphoribosylformylglycinamidine synthase
MTEQKIIHYYRKSETPHSLLASCQEQLSSLGLEDDANKVTSIDTESCFNVLAGELSAIQKDRLEWLLAETFEKDYLQLEQSFFSSNACSICQACDIPVERLELSKRYRFVSTEALSNVAISVLKAMLHDRMTEEEYSTALTTFDNGVQPEPVISVPIMEHGRAALERINEERGLGFDDFDLDYYTKLFKVIMQLLLHSKEGCRVSSISTL